ncbi:hypothetical protein GCM10010911_18380 [Paenibacillus nasutitermitis]|uniref:Uncharacterized protein n=1 Tax=Paenibacillus nasutitermitis TaxID=1652958 RepID=A0A916YTS0_9BACL|nr:hypothetical protein GCM10010911_18380 [Paenibacillus nasutitermitis]
MSIDKGLEPFRTKRTCKITFVKFGLDPPEYRKKELTAGKKKSNVILDTGI